MSAPKSLPLSGVRVIDCSRLIPGDYTTMLLAELGADVIKVEGPPAGDYLRGIPPMHGEMSAMYLSLNRSKRSIGVDHRSEEGRKLIERLVAESDVFVEVSAPGSMKRFGLDYESLLKIKPDLVYCSITGY